MNYFTLACFLAFLVHAGFIAYDLNWPSETTTRKVSIDSKVVIIQLILTFKVPGEKSG